MDWNKSSLPPAYARWREEHRSLQDRIEKLEREQIELMLCDGHRWNEQAKCLENKAEHPSGTFERFRFVSGNHAATVRERRNVARYFADANGAMSVDNINRYIALRGNGTREPKTWRAFVLAAKWLDSYL